MKQQFCKWCDRVTWQNPVKVASKASPEYRCTQCGEPHRYGAKHTIKIGGRVMNMPKP